MIQRLGALMIAFTFASAAAHGGVGLEDQADRFFVDAVGGNDLNTGVRAAPLRTIQEGIDRADQLGGGDVVVAAVGTYTETLTLASNVDVRGGFDPVNWTRDSKGVNTLSTIEGGFTAVVGNGITDVLFEGFVVNAMHAGNQIQISSIALSLHNSVNVVIRQNTLMARNGGYGETGRDGTVGQPGSDGGDGNPAVVATDFTVARTGGEAGSGASPNDGGRGGNGGVPRAVAGDLPAINGAPGLGNLEGFGTGGDAALGDLDAPIADANGDHGIDGMGGLPGNDGAPGAASGPFSEGGYVPADGGPGESGQNGGGGGGGGGGFGLLSGILPPIVWAGASGGGGGSGGSGGGSGEVGQGGGASIGLLLTESTDISITGNEIITGNGGIAGGSGFGLDGGVGGEGGSGGEGALGLQAFGGDGGKGGRGGPGGDGGNGGGGPSIGIAEDRTTFSTIANNVFTLGNGGIGASTTGSAARAPNGLVAETFKHPGAADIDGDFIVRAVDVQLVINGALGISTGGFSTDVDGDNDTDAIDVQDVINTALGL